MAQSDSQPGRSSDPPTDPPTVIDQELYGSPDGEERRMSVRRESDSGTRTILHHHEPKDARVAAPSDSELEDQKTVISRRPPGPPLSTRTSPRELATLLEGVQLGDYVLDEFVGGGGMGAVFRGTDLELSRTVAVKVLSRDQGADPETLRRFKNEAQSAARLDHDNIARVFFVGEQDGWNFIVFEFIEGVNIRDLVEQRGPLPLETCIEYVAQVAEALEHAAEREVVHRDIKPSNILITPDGRAKLVDMGLARLHHMEAGHSDLTASGVTLGTFDYISPEQASDPRQADVRSDLYSLGCTLFYMLTGRAPFPHGTVLQKLLAHSGEAPPDPCKQRPDLPPELTKVIFRLLAKRPAQRYQQPREFINEMLVLRDRLGLGELENVALAPHAERITWRERMLTIGLPIAILLLGFLGLDSYWSRSASNAEQAPGFHATDMGERESTGSPAGGTSPESERPGDDAQTSADGTSAKQGSVTSESDTSNNSPAAGGDGASSSGVEDGSATTTLPPVASASDGPSTPGPPTNASDTQEGGTPSEGEDAPDDNPSPAIPPLRRIVIGDATALGDLGPDTRIFSKLSAALASDDFQDNLTHINEIEIRQMQLREATPLRIQLPPEKHLTIRGVAEGGFQPTLHLTASATGQPDRSRGMIEVEGGRLSLDNLHVRMRVEDNVDRSLDVALMRIPARRERPVEFSRCILTIENPPSALAPSVAFFDIAAPRSSPREDTTGEPPERLRLNLSDCVLRGQATVIRMRQSAPLNFFWNNGLLATTERLLMAQGTMHKVDDTSMRLSMLNVTAEVGLGLCLLRDSDERPHQLDLELVCNKSIISAGDNALVEHDGVGRYDEYRRSLFIRGDSNVYEDVAPFWAVAIDNVEEPGMNWTAWSETLEMTGGMPSSISPIGWARRRAEMVPVAASERGVADYLIDPESPGAAAIDSGEIAGLKEEALPAIPSATAPRQPMLLVEPETPDAT